MMCGMAERAQCPPYAAQTVLSGTFVKHGLIGLVLIGKIDRLVFAHGKIDIAQHLTSAWTFAIDMDRKCVALALAFQNGAKPKHRIDLARRNLHARYIGVRAVGLAGLVF